MCHLPLCYFFTGILSHSLPLSLFLSCPSIWSFDVNPLPHDSFIISCQSCLFLSLRESCVANFFSCFLSSLASVFSERFLSLPFSPLPSWNNQFTKKVASSIYCLTIHTMMWRVSCPENYHLKDDRLRLCFLFLESLFLISSERWDWDWRDKELTSLETKCIQYQEHEGICFFSRIRNFYLRFGEKRNQVEVVRVGLTFTHTPSKRLLLSSVSDFLSSRVHWFPYFSPTLLFFAKKSLFDAREVDDAQYTFSSCVTLTCFSSWVINPGFFVSRRKKISVSDKTKKEERRSETCVTEHTFRVKNR